MPAEPPPVPAAAPGGSTPLPAALVAGIDGSADDPATALLMAAARLFTLHGPSQVSLREVAAEANVNYGLIHRHYRSKEGLVAAVFREFAKYGGRFIHGQHDVYAATEATFHADAGQFAHMLAWAVLDGTAPERVFPDTSSMVAFRALLDELYADPVPPRVEDPFDPRVVASVLMLVTMTWDFYAPYLAQLMEATDLDPAEVRRQVVDLLQLTAYAAAAPP